MSPSTWRTIRTRWNPWAGQCWWRWRCPTRRTQVDGKVNLDAMTYTTESSPQERAAPYWSLKTYVLTFQMRYSLMASDKGLSVLEPSPSFGRRSSCSSSAIQASKTDLFSFPTEVKRILPSPCRRKKRADGSRSSREKQASQMTN